MERFFENSFVVFCACIPMTLSLLGCKHLYGQSTPYRHYVTQTVEQRLLEEDTTLQIKKQDIETYIKNFALAENVTPITIPVVFHVLHPAEAKAIPKEQLLAQLAALNRDFAGQLIPSPTPQAEVFLAQQAIDIGIQFCLAQSNDNQVGIIYKTSEQNWTTDNTLKSIESGGSTPWNPAQYLNIWIADLADNITGYAQMPGGEVATDGIVLAPQFLASDNETHTNHLGRALVHLVGSYLGLYELWQPNCGDDFCADTPIHNAPNLGCEDYKHVSFCPPHQAEMTMNFMDMGTSACTPYMFTLDQSKRMHAILSEGGFRAGLSQGTTLCSREENNLATLRSTKFTPPILKTNIQVQLNPNPTAADVTLSLSGRSTTLAEVVVYDNLGRLHYEASLTTPTELSIPTQDWQSGIYYVFIRADQQVQTHQLVILPN